MEEYRNKWNINMNTLGLADYNVKEDIKAYGFAMEQNDVIETYLYTDESECVRTWYNMHCKPIEQISEICEVVLEKDYDEAKWENQKNSLKNLPLLKVLNIKESIVESEYLHYSMLCNGFLQGNQNDVMTQEQLQQYGYGLIYWQEDCKNVFFDNRMAVMFRKLKELQKENIYPICLRLKKTNHQPIPVADGRKQINEIALQENLQMQYYELQRYIKFK